MDIERKLPQAKYRKFLKPYWNKGLSECKKIVKAHWHEWVSNGRPRDDTNDSFASKKQQKGVIVMLFVRQNVNTN